jgi:hypothetical protein
LRRRTLQAFPPARWPEKVTDTIAASKYNSIYYVCLNNKRSIK